MTVEQEHAQQEEDRLSTRIVAVVAIVTVVIFVVSIWVAWLMLPAEPYGPPAAMPSQRYGYDPSPIETVLRAERFNDRARRRIESYGFVDEQRAVAHVPVQRAMEMFLERREGP